MKTRFKREAVYRSFQLQKSLPKDKIALPSSLSLCWQSWLFFKKNWLCFTVLAVFMTAAFVFIFLSQTPAINLSESKEILGQRFDSDLAGYLQQSFYLLNDVFSNFLEQAAAALGFFIIFSLVFGLMLWWVIRHLLEGKKFRIRDAFYFGPAQIIPYLFLTVLLLLQLLPALIVADFGATLRENGVLDGYWEQTAALLVIVLVFALATYWLLSGVFSLIVVSLPGMRPFAAWRIALNLVHRRRQLVLAYFIPPLLLIAVFNSLFLLPLGWFLTNFVHHIAYLSYFYGITFFHIYAFLFYQNLIKMKEKTVAEDDED